MESVYDALKLVLGLGIDPKDLQVFQVCTRAIVIFIAALIMVRVGDKRFLSRKTAFDAVLGFVLASMMARAINGSAPFFGTIVAGFLLVGLHRLFATIAGAHHPFGMLIKGNSERVITDGEVRHDVLKKNDFSEMDLLEDLRLNGKVESPAEVKTAFIERDGSISVVPKKS